MIDEMYIIDRIEKLCEERNLSRYRLAQKAGIAQSSLSTLLNRKSIPTIQTLEKICSGFDITLAQFFAAENEIPDLTDEQRELLDTWNNMNEQERALVKAYMQGIMRT